jgi:uncharacterized protein YndB with AHSA1/START domain
MIETKMTLIIKRTFQAQREKVFAAWTQAEALKQWWGTEGHTVPAAEMDLSVGGKYRVEMRTDEGESFYLNGAFVEITPLERLVFTFRWERGEWDYPETLVSIDFTGEGDETTVTLTHEGFPDENMRDEHHGGWGECLENLGAYLGGG